MVNSKRRPLEGIEYTDKHEQKVSLFLPTDPKKDVGLRYLFYVANKTINN